MQVNAFLPKLFLLLDFFSYNHVNILLYSIVYQLNITVHTFNVPFQFTLYLLICLTFHPFLSPFIPPPAAPFTLNEWLHKYMPGNES